MYERTAENKTGIWQENEEFKEICDPVWITMRIKEPKNGVKPYEYMGYF